MKLLCRCLSLWPVVLLICLAAAAQETQPVSSATDAPVVDASPSGRFDASLFEGADICAKTNRAVGAAFAARKQPGIEGMAALRGRVRIPAGNYLCRTALHVPHGVWISGDGDATFLTWAGAGPAVIVSDVAAPGEYVEGVLSDLHIRGTRTAGQEGIFVGGDSACKDLCTANPPTNVGYDYVLRNVTVLNMGGNGIEYGNNAFNLLWDNVHSNNNRGYGLYVPHTATGGGQYNTWTHSQLAGNALGGWWIDQLPFVAFEMFAEDVQGNADNDGAPTDAEVTGGHVICMGCHFEHGQGAFFGLNSKGQFYKSDDIELVGGQLIATAGTGATDHALVLAGGAARFSSAGTFVVALHAVEEMVAVENPAAASVSVFATSLSMAAGVRFGGVTRARGQGIRYEEPVREQPGGGQAGSVAGARYFGGTTSFDTVETGTLGVKDGFSGTCSAGVVVSRGIVTGCK